MLSGPVHVPLPGWSPLLLFQRTWWYGWYRCSVSFAPLALVVRLVEPMRWPAPLICGEMVYHVPAGAANPHRHPRAPGGVVGARLPPDQRQLVQIIVPPECRTTGRAPLPPRTRSAGPPAPAEGRGSARPIRRTSSHPGPAWACRPGSARPGVSLAPTFCCVRLYHDHSPVDDLLMAGPVTTAG
jgi:hypothetical protein